MKTYRHIYSHFSHPLKKKVEKKKEEFPLWLSGLRTQLVSMKIQVQSLALLSGLRICIGTSCGVDRECSSDLGLLWLRRGPEAATLIQPLAWEPPYAAGVALKKKERKKKERIEKSHSPITTPQPNRSCPPTPPHPRMPVCGGPDRDPAKPASW